MSQTGHKSRYFSFTFSLVSIYFHCFFICFLGHRQGNQPAVNQFVPFPLNFIVSLIKIFFILRNEFLIKLQKTKYIENVKIFEYLHLLQYTYFLQATRTRLQSSKLLIFSRFLGLKVV